MQIHGSTIEVTPRNRLLGSKSSIANPANRQFESTIRNRQFNLQSPICNLQ